MNNNINQPKTIEDLDKIIQQSQKKQHKSVAGYVVGGLIFPPFTLFIAIYLAWKRKLLYLFLPTINIVHSLLTLLLIALSISSLSPVMNLASILEQPQTLNLQIKIIIGFAVLLTIFGFFSGIFFRNKAKKENQLNKSVIILLLGLLVT